MANLYGDLGVKAGVFAEKKLLEHAEPQLVLHKFADHKTMPKNSSDTIKWRRPIPFAPATTPLTEGVTPSMVDFRYEDKVATLEQYGNVTPITDVVDDLHENAVGSDMAMLMGENAAQTAEKLAWGVLRAGVNVLYADNVGTRNAVNTTITLGMQRKATRALMANKAKKLTSILDGSPKYATKPVEAAYIAVTHTDVAAQIRKLPGFVPVAEYGARQPVCAEEIGSVEDVRYVCSAELEPFADAGAAAGGTYLSTGGTNCDVYPIIFLGAKAWGAVALKGSKAFGGAIKPIVRNPGTPDSNDPLGQMGSVGYKFYFKCVLLNDAWMVRGEIAVETDPS